MRCLSQYVSLSDYRICRLMSRSSTPPQVVVHDLLLIALNDWIRPLGPHRKPLLRRGASNTRRSCSFPNFLFRGDGCAILLDMLWSETFRSLRGSSIRKLQTGS